MSEPPVHLKARYVLLWAIPAFLIGILPLTAISPDWFSPYGGVNGPLYMALMTFALEGGWFALTVAHANAIGMRIRELFTWTEIPVSRVAPVALATLGSAIFCLYVVFAPLSLVFPDAVHWLLFQDQPVIYAPAGSLLANLLSLVAVCLVAPIAEEWLFRGLLLRRWSAKVGVIRAVVRTSLIFCLLHADPLGSFMFAVTMAGLYARYRTLWAPIIVHVAHNSLVFIAAAVMAHAGVDGPVTVEDLRAQWWMPVVGAAVTLPWLLRLRKSWVPVAQWQFET